MRPFVIPLALLLAGCAGRTDLAYKPPATPPVTGRPSIAAVQVADERDVSPRNVGAVIGINGKPLKPVQTGEPVPDAVARAFREALAARGELAGDGIGRYDLQITILALHGEQWAERHGEADLVVRLVERSTGREVYSARTDEQSRGDNYRAVDNFEWGSAAALGRVADAALNRAINDTLDRRGFALALR